MRMKYLLWCCVFVMSDCTGTVKTNEEKIEPGVFQVGEYLPLLTGKNIAVVANNASVLKNTHLVDTILNSDPTINIKAIFSPEHGFSGNFEAGKVIDGDEVEYNTVEIISLYGKNKKPQQEVLNGIDVVLFDLQDVGVRFYTYISTLHYVMQACAENNIPVIVLDRPNPHCNYIDGPVLEPEQKSFVGMHPVPVVYGMTIGEYAQMINGEGWLGANLSCELTVVAVKNYTRDAEFNFAEAPSPNLPNMKSIYLYPSLCFFEGTVVSVGRGTGAPFQIFGHPDLNGKFSFVPQSIPGVSDNPKLEGQQCFGYDLTRLQADSLRGQKQLEISYLLNAFAALDLKEGFFTNYFDLLAGTDKFKKAILEGKTEGAIRKDWEKGLAEFTLVREKYLIYQ